MLALIGGAAVFIIKDPLGVMPGFYQAFQQAASETFPSRQVARTASCRPIRWGTPRAMTLPSSAR